MEDPQVAPGHCDPCCTCPGIAEYQAGGQLGTAALNGACCQRMLPAPRGAIFRRLTTRPGLGWEPQELPAPLGMQVKEADVLETLHLTHSELDFHSISTASWRPLYNSKASKPVGSCERPGLSPFTFIPFRPINHPRGSSHRGPSPGSMEPNQCRFLPTRRPWSKRKLTRQRGKEADTPKCCRGCNGDFRAGSC